MIDINGIEERVISAALNDAECMNRMLADCDSVEFENPLCRAAFIEAANISKTGKTPTLITIRKRMNAEESAELFSIYADVYSNTATFGNALSDLREAFTNRMLAAKLGELKARAEANDGDVLSLAADAIEKIQLRDAELAPKKHDSGEDRALAAFMAIGEQTDKVRTGFLGIDSEIGGYAKGSLNVIGGRPSMGKSTFAMNVALNILKDGGNVAYFTFEDSEESLIQRMIANLSKTSLWFISHESRGADAGMKAADKIGKWMDRKLFVNDTAMMTVSKIRSIVRIWQRRVEGGSFTAVILDYLGYIRPEDFGRRGAEKTRVQQIGEITKDLKRLAKEMDCPVILLCQLNRGADSVDAAPRMSDLRESGDIEQDADTVMFLNRPWVRDKDADKEEAYAIFLKNRNGSIGSVRLRFIGNTYTFESYDDVPKEWKGEDAE